MLFGSLINPTSSSYSRLNCVGCGTPPPPRVVDYFIALSCYDFIVPCLTVYPGSGNNVPDTPTSFSGKSVSGE